MLDLSGAPTEPIERLLWLSGVREQVTDELDREYGKAYFNARLQGPDVFDTALDLHLHSRKRIMAYTRSENERRGRPLRWGDGH